MKSLVEYISESQVNDTVKDLFSQMHKRLKYREWDEVNPIIEKIFKAKWGKTVKAGDSFKKAVDNGAQNMLLGYIPKGKLWIIARYNSRDHGVRGVMYNGDYFRQIGLDTPEYWSNINYIVKSINANLKLRFGDAYEEPAKIITLGLDMLSYDFED